MTPNSLRTYINIAGDMYQPVQHYSAPVGQSTPSEEELPVADTFENTPASPEFIKDEMERLAFKLRSLQAPDQGAFAEGYETAMAQAADMLENLLARIGGM